MAKQITIEKLLLSKTVMGLKLSVAVALVAVFVSWSLPTQVVAHQADTKRVEQHISSISRQLRALQETVLEHMDNHSNRGSGANTNQTSSQASGGNSALLADMEIRLGAIDREFRQLTGKIEEMDHRQAQLARQFENFKADMELRFQDISSAREIDNSEIQAVAETPVTVSPEPEVQTEEVQERVELTAKGPEESYEEAFGFLRRGDFESAEASFSSFLQQHSEHELAGNAQYWLAETFYARRDYTNAAAAFLKGYQDYSDGTKAPDSLLKLGMSLAAMEQIEEACMVFDDLKIRYSNATQTILDSADRELARYSCQ